MIYAPHSIYALDIRATLYICIGYTHATHSIYALDVHTPLLSLQMCSPQTIMLDEKISALKAQLRRLEESRERNSSYDPHLAAQAGRRIEAVNAELQMAQQRLEEMRTKSKHQRGGIEKAAKHVF
jgi:hypothetical protein